MITNISEHITYSEAIYSNTAKIHHIDNTPTPNQIDNMIAVAENIFEPVREHVCGNRPLFISSFFRSILLNRKIKGAKKSGHLDGIAIDLDCDKYGYGTNLELFNYIKYNLEFDILIWEYGTMEKPDWVHVSFKKTGYNSKSVYKTYKEKGSTKTKYLKLN